MNLSLGEALQIRSMIYVAGQPVSFFWPMRSFIHHNPLHAFEHLPFAEGVEKGRQLFHARGFLSRPMYQRYLTQGQVDRAALTASVKAFAAQHDAVRGIDLSEWLMALITECTQPVIPPQTLASAEDLRAAIQGAPPPSLTEADSDRLTKQIRHVMHERLSGDCPVYEAVDALYGTRIRTSLDELVIKSCLDFFDEGQSVWGMPDRERGLFSAWRGVARRDVRLFLRGLHINRILKEAGSPEGIIAHVMHALEIPRDRWVGCFTRELAQLHGWVGFIRWRASAHHYYWSRRFPADLVDFMAVRLTLALALLYERKRKHIPGSATEVAQLIDERTQEVYLRQELHGGQVLPALAHPVDDALARGSEARIRGVFNDYVREKRGVEARGLAMRLHELAQRTGEQKALARLNAEQLDALVATLKEFEQGEGLLWLQAMESHAMSGVLNGMSLATPPPREKRPFVQALFCIDTRSERIRRNLESVGDYQTFGIAGFFGVPVSFMEMGKGSETHLCPALLTPRHLVLEVTAARPQDEPALSSLEKAMHELKESVLTPFVTVEAIGLLFGFDMIGKTIAPETYNRWRQGLLPQKPTTRLLLDKLSREQADSIVRAVQRAVIVTAVEHEFRLPPEKMTDSMVRELREAALEHRAGAPEFAGTLGVDERTAKAFVDRLQVSYHINPGFAQMQLEQLGRIGFTLDEQTNFVSQALRSIGLTERFSRFILLVGHGSTTENNPYASALDCGACGGNHGLVSARVLAQMANRPQVRRRLRTQGIDIADDAWFVPALHNTTSDEVKLFDLDLLPPSHLVYLDRLRKGLAAAARLCAQERLPSLTPYVSTLDPSTAARSARRNAMDWSQARPEWGLSRNAFFIIGRRSLTSGSSLEGRAFLHSYDFRLDPKRRLLENILTGPLVVGQWINMEHYFSTVDNQCYGSGSKVYQNVAGRFGVMTGNLSDLRTGLPAQTVLKDGLPYHEPMRLITFIEAPFDHALRAIRSVPAVRHLVENGWIRLLIIDPETGQVSTFQDGQWQSRPFGSPQASVPLQEANTL